MQRTPSLHQILHCPAQETLKQKKPIPFCYKPRYVKAFEIIADTAKFISLHTIDVWSFCNAGKEKVNIRRRLHWIAKWDYGFLIYDIKKMQFLKYFVGHLDY